MSILNKERHTRKPVVYAKRHHIGGLGDCRGRYEINHSFGARQAEFYRSRPVEHQGQTGKTNNLMERPEDCRWYFIMHVGDILTMVLLGNKGSSNNGAPQMQPRSPVNELSTSQAADFQNTQEAIPHPWLPLFKFSQPCISVSCE